MITIKSEREIELMRHAGMLVSKMHQFIKPYIKEGITTKELDKLCEDFIRSNDGIPTEKGYEGFPASICASVNDEVVHGIPGSRKLKNGDIITIDIGVYYQGYHADAAVTYPVGKVSDKVNDLLRVTEEALYVGLKEAKPGVHLSNISHAIEEFIKPHGYGIVEEFTGHGIGRSLHEEPYVPNFGKANEGPILEEGMTICVEPMVNMGTKSVKILRDNWTTVTIDRKYSAHFEHTIAITKDGYEILTKINKE